MDQVLVSLDLKSTMDCWGKVLLLVHTNNKEQRKSTNVTLPFQTNGTNSIILLGISLPDTMKPNVQQSLRACTNLMGGMTRQIFDFKKQCYLCLYYPICNSSHTNIIFPLLISPTSTCICPLLFLIENLIHLHIFLSKY